jgi:hypothetical protein
VEAAQTIGDDDGPAVQGFVALIKDALWWGGTGWVFAGKMKGWVEEGRICRCEGGSD